LKGGNQRVFRAGARRRYKVLLDKKGVLTETTQTPPQMESEGRGRGKNYGKVRADDNLGNGNLKEKSHGEIRTTDAQPTNR